jgi:hypothetical protein
MHSLSASRVYSSEMKMATEDLGIEVCINILEIALVALRTALEYWLVQD